MSLGDLWSRTLVYFGIAEEDDDYFEDDETYTAAEESLEQSYRERPNVRRLTPRLAPRLALDRRGRRRLAFAGFGGRHARGLHPTLGTSPPSSKEDTPDAGRVPAALSVAGVRVLLAHSPRSSVHTRLKFSHADQRSRSNAAAEAPGAGPHREPVR